MSSVAARAPVPERGAYTPAKAGLIGLAGMLSLEWANYDINVNAVCPGMVLTPMTELVYKREPALRGQRLKRMPAGREASNRAVRTLRNALTRAEPRIENLRPAILDAIEEANRGIIDSGRGAGTTLVVGEIARGRVRSYHVGDSEIISVGQRGRLKLRLTPHSPTGFAVEAGLLDEDEAVRHDERHLLFNAIGSADMSIEIGSPVKLDARDTVLLASDGLMDNLYVDEIVEIVRKGPLADAADELIRRAVERMTQSSGDEPSKPDDLTVMLFRKKRPAKT
jgi:serine/threonine protein phosphatase PrpC